MTEPIVSLLDEYDSMESRSCPKCGGDGGYLYLRRVEYIQLRGWDGQYIQADPSMSYDWEGKMAECNDCHARFRRSSIDDTTGGAK